MTSMIHLPTPTRLAALVLAACVVVGAMPARTQPAALSLEAEVDRYLQPYLDTGNFSGSVLIGRGGKILLSKAYGSASLEHEVRNTSESVFHLASMSRIFTSASILLLEQQGKLTVDDPLSKYLPAWPRGNEITIHHLLTLSAGFPNINSMPDYDIWQMFPQTPETLVEKFRDLPLEFEPGEESVHSNSNYNVLALLIEKLSGRTYGEFLEAEIFAPLEMTQTAHHGDAARIVHHRATGYTPSGLAQLILAPTIDWSVKTGNGSIYSTAEDLYKLDRALVRRSLLKEEAVTKTFTEYFPHVGYGWFIRERFGTTEIHINGRSPGFGTYWGRSVGNDVTVILLGNIYNSVTTPIGRDLIAMVLGEEFEPPPLSAEPPDPALLAEIVGSYQFGPEFYAPNAIVTFHVQDGHLFNGSGWIMPTEGLRFVHRIYWSDLEFLRDDGGKIAELQYDRFVGKKID
jgi:CubicO group peptidase (beta-lactamase class C family)